MTKETVHGDEQRTGDSEVGNSDVQQLHNEEKSNTEDNADVFQGGRNG